MRKYFIFPVLLLLSSSYISNAQDFSIKGTVFDKQQKSSLPGATVVVTNIADSAIIRYAITNDKGYFILHPLKKQQYKLKVYFVGYEKFEKIIEIKSEDEDLGLLYLNPKREEIKEVVISGTAPASIQKGDTTEMYSAAYKTKSDATAEDLVTKMPTVTVENNVVKAQGENVNQVLVDGKPFFGDDPTVALRSLPADVIDKIQIFNKLSDQAELTGFDDGQTSKTMNIVTKKNSRNGTFGKIYAGHDYYDKYQYGGSLNLFDDDRRISLIGMSNDINQQNFSGQDLIGLSGNSGNNRSMGGNGGMGGRRGNTGGGIGGPGGPGGPGGFGGNNSSNFLVGQQNGVSTTNSAGINYSDTWGQKLKISGSYFYNNSRNDLYQSLFTKYADNRLPHSEQDSSTSRNYNNRFNIRMEYTIDTMNSIIFVPKLNFQNNNTQTSQIGGTINQDGSILYPYNNYNNSVASAYNLSGEFTYRHKFSKKGRTISIRINATDNNKNPVTTIRFKDIESLKVIQLNDSSDQLSNATTKTRSISSNLMYTEPAGKNGLWQFNYSYSFANNTTNKLTYNLLDTLSPGVFPLDTPLSNYYNSNYLTNLAGIGYRFKGTKFNGSVNLNFQTANLTGERTFPLTADTFINKTFNNFLPGAMFRYNFSAKNNLMIVYRASTNPPTIAQLQNVIDNSNSPMLTIGNPNLKQEYNHTLISRFAFANPEKSRNFFGFLSVTYTLNPISNFTDTSRKDIRLYKGIVYTEGAQLTQPVNLDNKWNINSLLTYGFPLNFVKCNINLNTGFNYTRTPGQINDLINISNSYTISQGIVFSSNISENLDFTLSYTGNYNIINNSIEPTLNNNYFSQTANFKCNWIFWKGIVLQNDITNQLYRGLSSANYNQNYFLWNIAFGKKLFKNQQGEIKIGVFDLLNQNNTESIVNNGNNTEYSKVNALKRYYMLTFTYNLRIRKTT